MAKQLTLFGSVARSDSADKNSSIYKNPVGSYQCFIERYYQRNRKSGKTRQQIVTEAQALWKISDDAAKKSFETLAQREVV